LLAQAVLPNALLERWPSRSIADNEQMKRGAVWLLCDPVDDLF
jgi:hypothetical protein